MTNVTLNLPIGEIVRILSQPYSEEREEAMREAGKERGVLKPKFISILKAVTLLNALRIRDMS